MLNAMLCKAIPEHVIIISVLLFFHCSIAEWCNTPESDSDTHSSNQSNGLLTSRPKRYILSEQKWSSRKISWRLLNNYLNAKDKLLVRRTLRKAFHLWATASSLRFTEIPDGPSDLIISFAKGDHGDGLPFDGKFGIAAHAFYPTDGRLHFDADEYWTLNSKYGINLYQTAVHEIGHAIGLEHSTDERAVMHARKQPYDPNFTLADDDVRGVRRLYPILKKSKQLTDGST